MKNYDYQKVLLSGEVTRSEVRYSQEGKAVARFTLHTGNAYVSCVAFGKQAENVEKYYKDGTRCHLEGTLSTGSYQDKDGNTVFTTDVMVYSLSFGYGGDYNVVILDGRCTREPEMRVTTNGKSVASVSLAVTRQQWGENAGDPKTDFPNVVAWEEQAEKLVSLGKGTRCSVEGHISTRSYEKNGKKVYVTEVVATSISVAPSETSTAAPSMDSEFMDIPEGLAEDLPFLQ